MNSKIISYIILSAVILSVSANSIYLHVSTKRLSEAVKESDIYSATAISNFTEIYAYYKKHERFISLTVNHDDLTAIDEALCEIIGSLEVNDTEGAAVIKSRLIGSLEHLRRLSGINIDSII